MTFTTTVEQLNERFPVGTFFTLPPKYTIQLGAVLRVTAPFVIGSMMIWQNSNGNSLHSVGLLFGSFDCHWPDGGFSHYPKFIVHNTQDIHPIIDPDDEDLIAIKLLAKQDIPLNHQEYWDELIKLRKHMLEIKAEIGQKRNDRTTSLFQ